MHQFLMASTNYKLVILKKKLRFLFQILRANEFHLPAMVLVELVVVAVVLLSLEVALGLGILGVVVLQSFGPDLVTD